MSTTLHHLKAVSIVRISSTLRVKSRNNLSLFQELTYKTYSAMSPANGIKSLHLSHWVMLSEM